ncbi:MAG: tRNA (N6-isopentenyl adenosine(37)-C2)-methylthiotransferase MiaB [Clostridiales bacterium]|nr:tRNA (N6-isopentenyl adenosine(37)-C2)-methylthiotransferase MiaB [Clostridiales bacterium]
MREHVQQITPEQLTEQAQFSKLVQGHGKRPQSYYIVTYGCQMNAHDSETLAGTLRGMGLEQAPTREQADLVLFNTCCIRDNAERRALGNITWLKEIKRDRPHMLIGVCGCMMQQQGMAEKVLRQYPFVDIAFGTGNLYRLPEYLYLTIEEGRRVIDVSKEESTIAEGLPVHRDSPFKAYVSIMFGCDNYCSYCIVPYVRGRERSRRAADILREAEALVADGVQEITLLGQNVNSYGHDLHEISFAQLLRRLEDTGIRRLRFMTSHPKDLSDELIEEMARNRALAPHLHLPVQAGSDRILTAMNRRYTVREYLEKVRKLRNAVPEIGLTTDLIVAFPGETEEDFAQTMALVEQVRYDSAFTFIYSPRTGTKAASLPGALPAEVATERIERLIALQEKMTAQVLQNLVGRQMGILTEGQSTRRKSQMTGKCGRNISVNYTGGRSDHVGQIVPVYITGTGSNTLRGEYREDISHE